MTPPLQALRVPAGWSITYNDLREAEPSVEVFEGDLLREDLLQIRSLDGARLVDLGWYGSLSEGAFGVVVLAGDFLGPALERVRTRDLREAVSAVERMLRDYRVAPVDSPEDARARLLRGPLRDRFDGTRYLDDEPVRVAGAASEWLVPESIFCRAQAIAQAYQLHMLPVVDTHGTTHLTRAQCDGLAEEVALIRAVTIDPLLEQHLCHVEAILRACAVSPVSDAAVVIEGP